MIGAIALIYLLLVVNFQSWLDPVHHHQRPAGRPRGRGLGFVFDVYDAERAPR